MSKKQRAEAAKILAPYIRILADKMRLQDWEVMISDEPAGKGAIASTYCTSGRARVTVYFGKTFFTQTPEEQRLTIVHELNHCHFARMHNPLCDVLRKSAFAFYLEQFEHGVDVTAVLIAPSMPLPPKIK